MAGANESGSPYARRDLEDEQSAGDCADSSVAAEDERRPDCKLLAALCLVSSIEGADVALLPASFAALEEDLGFELQGIAALTIAQMVAAQAIGPLWGILADRGVLGKKSILMIGALGTGLTTISLGSMSHLAPMAVSRFMTGAFLAALRPVSNGIVADSTSDKYRGTIYARIQAALFTGMLVSTMCAVPIARRELFGVRGWRVALLLIGSYSVMICLVVGGFMVSPPKTQTSTRSEAKTDKKRGCGALLEELSTVLQFLSIPTFCIMILQGVFGTIPWSVMGNMILYMAKCGMKDEFTAVLSAAQLLSTIAGNLIGGKVADVLARRLGYHGRPLNAQISVALGILPMYLIFWGIPPESGDFWVYIVLNIAFGLLGTWAQSGTNYPVLSEIVPADARARVMAWEGAFENSVAMAIGPPAVALIATGMFGYDFGAERKAAEEAQKAGVEPSEEERLNNARALGAAMAAVVCVPWFIAFLAYGLLHFTYPRDVKKIQEAEKGSGKDSRVKASEENNNRQMENTC
eukprot:TRINITY_DN81156_c0_g1_i1.p1 TRINITY_DN81156_c0_g1~~TRINITY_DN81156_c0_g1_i1.p1  ORF type:complete len:522 (-),score=84.09 TRINITY_DN81156_c0_g1_i1:345-1910(-)